MDELSAAFVKMLELYPDPEGSRPIANYPATMYAVTLTFHVLSWIAVCGRLYTRFRVVRKPWWDDLAVFAAALVNLVSVVTFLGAINFGLGQHIVYVLPTYQSMVKWMYVSNAAYHTTTALIKISLLLQYLKLFRKGLLRHITIILLVLVTLWGLGFSFLAWFPCIPVSGMWDRTRDSKCYGFGAAVLSEVRVVLFTFASTNMFLDVVIFAIPLTEYFRPGLRRKQILAMTGLFFLGSIVVLMSILRLWTTFKRGSSTIKALDFTWWYPEVLIISCLEIDFAIMCASMPIFWPAVVANFNAIFITNEVHITHQDRTEFEMGRPTSVQTSSS
jgi:hypothetical protein